MQRPDLTVVLDHYGVDYIAGRNRQMIRCPSPDHDDYVKSCSVDLGEGVINCFGCSLKGSSIDLLMQVEGLDLRGAIEFGQSHFPGAGGEDVLGEPRFGKRVPRGKGFAPRYRRAVPARRRYRPDAGA